jgi:hypothetical protein
MLLNIKMKFNMKYAVILLVLNICSSPINAQESTTGDSAPLKLIAKPSLFAVAGSGFTENSYLLSAGVQAAKLFVLNYRDNEVVTFSIDQAAVGFRKQYRSGNTRPGAFLTASLNKKIFETLSGKSVFKATNVTIMDYGLNQFTSDGFNEDHALHFEISNLTAISFTQYFLKRSKAKLVLTPGFKISNLENPQFGYIASFLYSLGNPFIVYMKMDNTTTMEHRLTVGLMYRL